jgi:hypothetical protein
MGEHHQTALRQSHDPRAVMEQAEVRRWYARMLMDRNGPGDCAKARELLTEAVAIYRRVGMLKHVEMAEALLGEEWAPTGGWSASLRLCTCLQSRRPPFGGPRDACVVTSRGRWSGRRESNPRQPAWEAGFPGHPSVALTPPGDSLLESTSDVALLRHGAGGVAFSLAHAGGCK